MNPDLDDRALALITGVLARHPEVEGVAVFGSRALGSARPNSDIDLAVWGAGVDAAAVARLAGELDELPLPYLFDVVAFDLVTHPPLREHILRHGRRIYPAP